MKKYQIELPESLHQKVKVRAAKKNITMKKIFLEALKEFLEESEAEV